MKLQTIYDTVNVYTRMVALIIMNYTLVFFRQVRKAAKRMHGR